MTPTLAGVLRRALIAAAAALAVLALPAAAAASSVDPLRPWALQNEAGDYDVSLSDAIQHARRHDLITAQPIHYTGDLAAMRAANPDVRVYVYLNGTFAQKTDGERWPASWYARDAQGRKVRNLVTGNFMMLPNVDGWVRSRIDECRARIVLTGYDGCDVDMLGPAPTVSGYVTAPAINRATGRAWTKAEWLRATSALAARVKAAVAPALVVGNGLSTGAHYWDPAGGTRQILAGIDGASAEAWLRGAKTPIGEYRSEAEWRQDVDMVADAEARGKSLLTLTKVWAPGTAEQKEAWRRYALASYLLASGGRSYFTFSASPTQPPTAWNPIYAEDLGSPLAPYARAGGVYQRRFADGRVLVNPSGRPVTVWLGGTLYTTTGLAVTKVTLGAHTGEILTTTP
jgi:hypothetical protein